MSQGRKTKQEKKSPKKVAPSKSMVPVLERLMEKEVLFTPKDILSRVRPTPMIETHMPDDEKVRQITEKFTEIMTILGLDLENDSLRKTPQRVAKMYVHELFQGMDKRNFPKITVIENDMNYDQMIVVKDVSIISTCEHHFITIHGLAHIAYIPNRRVIGLSKINRIARYFSKRPQVQERLTKQIADALSYVLDTPNVAVYIDAKHYCVISRGVEDIDSTTATCDLRGAFKEDMKTRAEFMTHCRRVASR